MARERILVIDDNPTNLKLAMLTLAVEGYEVRAAVDATEALALIAEFVPQLILMDIQLPGIDGLELTRQLKADPNTRTVPILALTSYAMKGDEDRAMEAGCDGYLAKPIDTRTFPSIVGGYFTREP